MKKKYDRRGVVALIEAVDTGKKPYVRRGVRDPYWADPDKFKLHLLMEMGFFTDARCWECDFVADYNDLKSALEHARSHYTDVVSERRLLMSRETSEREELFRRTFDEIKAGNFSLEVAMARESVHVYRWRSLWKQFALDHSSE